MHFGGEANLAGLNWRSKMRALSPQRIIAWKQSAEIAKT
jgi:hypothetical protein